MKRYILSLMAMVLFSAISAQVAPNKYYIQFTDKNDSPYSITNPEEYLSERSIERRAKFNIAVTKQDFPVNPAYLQGVKSIGVDLLNPTKWLNGVTIYTEDPSLLDEIEALPYVSSIREMIDFNTNPKPFFEEEFYGSYRGQTDMTSHKSTTELDYGLSLNQIAMLNGVTLHEQGLMGQGMVIAVLDAGFRNADSMAVFDSLFANNQILGTKDFVDHSETVYDYHGHGTAVLSTMGGFYEGQLIGTAPKASYYLLRSEEANQQGIENIIEEYNWVSAAEFADSAGADIINSSLGYTTFDDPTQDHTYQDMDGKTTPITIGADIAATKGILVVNSAGNAGSSSWYYISAPADGDSVFTIGSVQPDSLISAFSSHGPTADGRIKPNVVAQGGPAYVAVEGGYFTFGSGTSFSSPIIAGMSACLWQSHPDCSNMDIMNALMQNGSYASDPNNDYGWGIPDFGNANLWLNLEENIISEQLLKIYPNPVIGNYFDLYLENEIDDRIVVRIFDQLGKTVFHEEYLPSDVNSGKLRVYGINYLPQGVFIVKIDSPEIMLNTKIIK